jgi:hypothetical protein
MDLSILPPINAALNATATLLLIFGRRLAQQGQVARHKRVMISAFGVSSLFLLLYVGHKVSRNFENTTYNAEGWAKSAYLVFGDGRVDLPPSVSTQSAAARLSSTRRPPNPSRLLEWAQPAASIVQRKVASIRQTERARRRPQSRSRRYAPLPSRRGLRGRKCRCQ